MATRANRGASQVNDDATSDGDLTKAEYERLATFRSALRHFLRQTELEARRLNLTPQHYQLLLSVKGFPGRDWATITELAERLQIRHNAVIGLVNRAEARGLIVRMSGPEGSDRRIVQIHLTPAGEGVLRSLAAALRSERLRVREALDGLERDLALDMAH
jgi:DNA-binding MarR family transcriptional regulator